MTLNKTTQKTTHNNQTMTPLYTPSQIYNIEKKWFKCGNASYGLMQQAAWQMAHWINKQHQEKIKGLVWVGSGNNGGDGWLVATYLKQLGADVKVIEVGQVKTEDAKLAKRAAQNNYIEIINFEEVIKNKAENKLDVKLDILTANSFHDANLFVDALFGIGLDRKPEGLYAKAISLINETAESSHICTVAVDVPSGLDASTGRVFEACAVKADVTLCLVARKIGLHIKDGMDYCGQVIDLPLIPSVLELMATAYLQSVASKMPKRNSNSHKGTFGHALIIGGNQVDGSQGMGGAALLSAMSAFSVGVGKLTVACHSAFHSSVITKLPNAMTMDLHDIDGVRDLIKHCEAIAIGMGLGRDAKSEHLFKTYLECAMQAGVDIVIDADGLYHLASLVTKQPKLKEQLVAYSAHFSASKPSPEIWYTPHSGEAARLLDGDVDSVEANRLEAIKKLATDYQGSWLLKGAGSIVLEPDDESKHETVYVCAAGNAGMATAGMGDVLSGVAVGLLAQKSSFRCTKGTQYNDADCAASAPNCTGLQQAVMIHAMAGDRLAKKVGEWAVQASDMHTTLKDVIKELT